MQQVADELGRPLRHVEGAVGGQEEDGRGGMALYDNVEYWIGSGEQRDEVQTARLLGLLRMMTKGTFATLIVTCQSRRCLPLSLQAKFDVREPLCLALFALTRLLWLRRSSPSTSQTRGDVRSSFSTTWTCI